MKLCTWFFGDTFGRFARSPIRKRQKNAVLSRPGSNYLSCSRPRRRIGGGAFVLELKTAPNVATQTEGESVFLLSSMSHTERWNNKHWEISTCTLCMAHAMIHLGHVGYVNPSRILHQMLKIYLVALLLTPQPLHWLQMMSYMTKSETWHGSPREGSVDMVQDSVGISLFATKNKVKREERRGGWHSLLKWGYIPQIPNKEMWPAGDVNDSLESQRSIQNAQSSQKLTQILSTHLPKPFGDSKLPSVRRFVKCLLNSSNTKRAVQKWGRKFRNPAEESE